VLNYDEILSNDDKDIAHCHYSLSLYDSEEVQNGAKQHQYHSAPGESDHLLSRDDKNLVPHHDWQGQNGSATPKSRSAIDKDDAALPKDDPATGWKGSAVSRDDSERDLNGAEVSKNASAIGTSRSAQGENDYPKEAQVACLSGWSENEGEGACPEKRYWDCLDRAIGDCRQGVLVGCCAVGPACPASAALSWHHSAVPPPFPDTGPDSSTTFPRPCPVHPVSYTQCPDYYTELLLFP